MKKLYGLIIATLLFGFAASTASAQGYYMPRQQARLQQALRNGAISQYDASRIQEQITRIYEFERNANADGYVDEYEKQVIDNERYSIARELDQYDRNWRNRSRYNRW